MLEGRVPNPPRPDSAEVARSVSVQERNTLSAEHQGIVGLSGLIAVMRLPPIEQHEKYLFMELLAAGNSAGRGEFPS
jgi:hypothetical protein